MQYELTMTVREALDGLYASLDDVAPDWERVVADAEREQRRGVLVRQPSRTRSSRYIRRGALVGAAAAVVALGVLSGLPGEGLLPGTGRSTIARAADALTPPDDAILHTVVVTTRRRPDGGTAVWKTETWQQTSPPYAARQIAGRELAQANGALQYYDPRTNTIHTTPPNSVPGSPTALAADEGLRERMLALLQSGEAREDGRVVVGGRDAIRIVSSDGSVRLVVDAATSEPIEWSWVGDDGVDETSRFQAYEWLPANKSNLALLSLTAQHPDAIVRQDATVTGTDGEGK